MEWALKSGGRLTGISAEVFVLGRGVDVHLRLDDDSVSRRHAALRSQADGLVVEDLHSRNGTLVNGRLILGRALLSAGDRIALGACILELVREHEASPFQRERVTQPISRDLDAGTLAVLSPREHEVFALLAEGVSQREMASRLGVSIKTLETYRTRIGQKLGVRSRAQLVRYAIDAGILRPSYDSW